MPKYRRDIFISIHGNSGCAASAGVVSFPANKGPLLVGRGRNFGSRVLIIDRVGRTYAAALRGEAVKETLYCGDDPDEPQPDNISSPLSSTTNDSSLVKRDE